MKKAYAVIGSGWGDEGKGNVTDILCSREPSKTINVRINGGSQASHTVVTPSGKRHAFRHFGAGTFLGVPTYLSKEFLVNVYTYDMERCDIEEKLGITPMVYVNPDARVTTLWDMNINQMIERMRGDNRHGSCGMGINETVHRSKYDEYRITVMDLFSEAKLYEKLERIQNEYVPQRLKNKYNLELDELAPEYAVLFVSEKTIGMTMSMAKRFTESVILMDDGVLNRYEIAVFEGAQGLLLDQGAQKFWPNVTTSNTGIKNMMEILNNLEYKDDLEIFYLSRCYATRHGRGIFPTETQEKPYEKIVDLTNMPNEFQEAMRFGILDIDLIIEAIKNDLKNLSRNATTNMILTCFDQVDDKVRYRFQGKDTSVSKEQFLKSMKSIFMHNISDLSDMYITQGDKRGSLIKI